MIERRSAGVGLLLAVTIVTVGCGATPKPDPDVPVPRSSLHDLQERVLSTKCDTEEFRDLADLVVRADREGVVEGGDPSGMPSSARFLVSTENLNNHQMHDCQRLIGPGDTVGTMMAERPLVAILPSESAMTRASFDKGVVVADLINYDSFSYRATGSPPLIIPEGLSCLWIRSGSAGWQAAIRQPLEGRCSTTYTKEPRRTLEVERHQVRKAPRPYPPLGRAPTAAERLALERLPPATASDYPHVARWMWDPETETQFIGIQCGAGWCEIGVPGFECTPGFMGIVEHVPGWWDAQFLSVPRGPNGELVLSGLWGRIEPGEDNRAIEKRSPEQWPYGSDVSHVATIRFLGDDAAAHSFYLDRFQLTAGASEHPIFFRTKRGFWLGSSPYQVRTEASSWKRVRRCDLSHSGTGTARWSWSDADEGFWVPCDMGCCVVRGF